MAAVSDPYFRPLRDLRISVTDRCNFRCPYCMPKEVFGPGYAFLREPQLMTVPEMTRIVSAFVSLGVQKVRLTGGEPLLRGDLPELVAALQGCHCSPRPESGETPLPLEITLTTNGWLLEKMAERLRAAGLKRVNVSLDALDPVIAGRMNGQGFSVERVLRGIDAAHRVGLGVKLNCVVQAGVNDGEVEKLAEFARERALPLRFIEFMDVGNTNRWSPAQVVPAAVLRDRIAARWPIEPVEPAYRGEVAARYRYRDGRGEIGLISSVTEPFCRDCHRARLSADGKLYTCLFASLGWDVLGCVRSGASDAEIETYIRRIWEGRLDRYSDERAEPQGNEPARAKIEMSYIGG